RGGRRNRHDLGSAGGRRGRGCAGGGLGDLQRRRRHRRRHAAAAGGGSMLRRIHVKWNQRKRQNRCAPSPVTTPLRVRYGGGLGRGRGCTNLVACPLPIPPPASDRKR